jgi:uncharacterized protein (UPF0254 family)
MKPVRKPTNLNKMGVHERVMFLEKQVTNLEMALRVSQTLMQQMLQQFVPMRNDLQTNVGIVNDFQYRVLAIQKLLNIDPVLLSKESDTIKLVDWQASSDKADLQEGVVAADEVKDKTNIIIITSTTPGETEDKGIFRSRARLEELNPEFQAALLGKKVNETAELSLNGLRHVVTLLGVRVKKEEPGEQV